MSKVEVNQISSQCGSTLTIGQSGDTVTLAAGATQSGFGRTGTVDWDTTAKTASFTAVSGNGYFVNTTSGAITVTLPASPSAGDIVSVKDYAGTAATNAITVARNGSNIRGNANNFTLEKNNAGATFIYVDATEGWQVFVDGSDSDVQQSFLCASGGTETTSGDFKIHTFTGPGTFTVNSIGCTGINDKVDYLVVAGGGGGGTGGAGAGGYRESCGTCYTSSPLGACVSALTVSAQGYPIAVGGGGTAGANCCTAGGPGAVSTFSTITSTGGGGGKVYNQSSPNSGNGGSGGGGAYTGSNTSAGSGNQPPVSPPQGKDGGAGAPTGSGRGGGGGGATVAGTAGPSQTGGGPGGTGATSSINATPTARAGGGGGGGFQSPYPGGTGGLGGGGAGGDGTNSAPGIAGTSGTTNTGGGGGGAGYYPGAPVNTISAGAGGSGIVIIRYKYQ
jgi:hypothetical protein